MTVDQHEHVHEIVPRNNDALEERNAKLRVLFETERERERNSSAETPVFVRSPIFPATMRPLFPSLFQRYTRLFMNAVGLL